MNQTKIFTAQKIFTHNSVLNSFCVVVQDNKIVTLCPIKEAPQGTLIDFGKLNLSAGFVDLQLNGCGGVLFNSDISKKALRQMHQTNLRHGCTSFCPTLITSSDQNIADAITLAKDVINQEGYANILGLHLEGPYISKEKKGIHDENYIRPPESNIIDLIEENAAYICILTVAPENFDNRFLTQLKGKIVLSAGHSNCDFETAQEAIDNGIGMATHIFNAMSALQSRQPNLIAACLNNQLYCGIIPDGLHVHPQNIKLVKKLIGEHLFAVTDAATAAGSSLKEFEFAGKRILVKDKKFIDANGCLAGSSLTMNQAVYNLSKICGFSLHEAIKSATVYPARAIGMEKTHGTLQKGAFANFAVFANLLDIKATVDQGQTFYF